MTKYQINPGDFRHVITFQKKSGVQNSYGEVSKNDSDWTDFITVRAGIYPVSSKEYFVAGSAFGEITHKVNLRYTSGITSGMRIKCDKRIFEIKTPPINFQERNILLQLLCKELI
jgi:SPP1 family predicted phage head-tail adaptor